MRSSMHSSGLFVKYFPKPILFATSAVISKSDLHSQRGSIAFCCNWMYGKGPVWISVVSNEEQTGRTMSAYSAEVMNLSDTTMKSRQGRTSLIILFLLQFLKKLVL